MSRLRRATFTVAIAGVILLVAGPAWAHVCTNASKADGAGSGAVANLELTDGSFEIISGEFNPQGSLRGGFVTIQVLIAGELITQGAIFAHIELSEMARNAGAGDDMCDGVGNDDLFACVVELLGA